jgi:hypothetical protein
VCTRRVKTGDKNTSTSELFSEEPLGTDGLAGLQIYPFLHLPALFIMQLALLAVSFITLSCSCLIPPKYKLMFTEIHSIIPQKIEIFSKQTPPQIL